MIVHICNDDIFVQRFVISLFDKLYNSKNIYIIVKEDNNLNNIKLNTNVIILSKKDKQILKYCNNAKIVILHSLFGGVNNIQISKINKNVKVMWSSYGGDYYNDIDFSKMFYSIYDKYSIRYNEIQKKESFAKLKSLQIISNYHKLRTGEHNKIFIKRKIIKRIDFFSTVLPNEEILVRKLYRLNNSVSYLRLSYGNIKQVLTNFYNDKLEIGNNIIIGNSATLSNNHIGAFELVKDVKCRVICPLNYGDTQYKNYVIKKGKFLFKDKFMPIEEFIPAKNYVSLLSSCGVMIMNHIRQQAVGNVILGLYIGMKVFLNTKNPLFKFLLENKIIVFDINLLKLDKKNMFKQLSKTDIIKNRDNLEKLWGEDVVNRRIVHSINTMLNL